MNEKSLYFSSSNWVETIFFQYLFLQFFFFFFFSNWKTYLFCLVLFIQNFRWFFIKKSIRTSTNDTSKNKRNENHACWLPIVDNAHVEEEEKQCTLFCINHILMYIFFFLLFISLTWLQKKKSNETQGRHQRMVCVGPMCLCLGKRWLPLCVV